MKLKIKYLPFLILLFVKINFCKGQINPESKRANHWYFGNKAGLDFTSGIPLVDLNSQMHQRETGSVMSDTNGNLLFYTNGDTIWNKNHIVMANGTGLLNCQSASQGGLILKKPGSTNLYYIFTNDCGENNGVIGVHYSVVDMSLNAGLGAVTIKNSLLYAPSTEKLTATYHCNGTDFWLVGQIRNSNQFCVYLLSNGGISSTPLITSIGYNHNDNSFFALPGAMKFSPNGNKLVVVYSIYPNGVEELYDFDKNTGLISNLITLPSDTVEYGASFSPDNSKLYIQAGSAIGVIGRIYQYDLSSNNAISIISSRNKVFEKQLSNNLLGLQLNTGKIYGAIYNTDTLLVINNPNSYSVSCNIVSNAVYLNGRLCQENLPQFIESYFSPTATSSICNVGIENNIIENDFEIFPNPCSSLLNINTSKDYIIDIIIYNLYGQHVLTENNLFNKKNTVDLSKINSGIYMLQIKQNNNTLIKRLLINH
jgi:hypothetical protein